MRISLFSWLIPVFFSISVVLVSGQCQSDQRQLLLELKSSFNSASLGKLVNWNQTTDCCSWDGVSCEADGRVIGLDLSNHLISGTINKSSSLFRLQHLQRLNLAHNRLIFAFPSEFDKFANLNYLNLSNSGFKGQIPAEISRMTSLVTLDLSTNFYLGQSLKLEKPNLKMLVGNLTRLRFLHLDGVNISASGKEWCQALSSLTNLQVLSMSNCYLSGPIDSSFSNLRSLSVIRLDSNNLSAPLPKFFADFRNLTSLRLSATDLTGRVPEEVLHATTLQTLDLSYNKLLKGSFQDFPLNTSLQTLVLSDTNIGGQLPESFGNLGQLTRIELARCNFSGPIPESMLQLTQLVYLDFSTNKFSGPMPSFSSSRNLTQLNLAFNQLNGTIRSTEWSGLSKLVSVDLRNNKLRGTIPPTLFAVPSLRKIFLSQNQFSGSLGDLLGKASLLLDTLDISSNNLQGQFPMSVFELQGIKILTLSSNNFSGFIKWYDIQKLRNLSNLDLSYNDLSIDASPTNFALSSFPNITTLKLASCNLTKFPAFLKTQAKLNHLDLSKNQIVGEIPNWIWEIKSLAYLNLSQNFLAKFEGPLQYISSSLIVVDLHANQLRGKIPSFPPYATYLDYSNNNLSSLLPPEIGDSLQFAIFFSLSGNNFIGSIPGSLCNSSYLQVLDLSNNSLSGPIPQCLTQMSVSLGVLNLRRNNLSGIISDTFPENCRLQTLDLNRNQVEGEVPQSLANCKKLEVLDIGNNQINGMFPCHLKNITKLRVLVLRSNKFNGNIHCPGNNSAWPMLQIVDVASNNFSGKLHQTCLATWEAMQAVENEAQSKLKHLQFKFLKLNPYYYQDSIKITMKGLEFELQKILTVFTSIDISCNNFEGPIPEVISTFNALYVLNFSHNAFAGTIPSFLGNLRQLESLDLSSNNLDGGIPFQLVNLNFLSFLNVSNNKLVGRIPTSTQLQSFSEASFENNTGLCGPPLSVPCQNAPNIPEFRSTDGFDWQTIFIGVGFGVGAAAFVAPLIFWKSASKWVNDNVDKILAVILPKVGLIYTRPDDAKFEAEENLEGDNTENDDEAEESKAKEAKGEEFRGRYCVFCSKLDKTRKKVIHDLCCTCYDSPSLSPSSSTSSSFSPQTLHLFFGLVCMFCI
ncbi:receptor-like protein 12 [Durio zibethinus]|uniref:Receptor-like protein 12 n=1 Tax=Durio zibethinus TaxID=66656 RepID=A0A6P5Z165_DURZI|nr:receptor-like protein 12 [Durio zibethinus]